MSASKIIAGADCLESQIDSRIKYLQHLLNRLQKTKDTDLVGKVVVSSTRGHFRYKYKETPSSKAEYLGKSQIKKVRKYLQTEYDQVTCHAAAAELKILFKIKKQYCIIHPEDVFYKLTPGKKAIVNPIIKPLDRFLEEWESLVFEPNPYPFLNDKLITEKGEHVRSKSEIMIANALFRRGIPYKYECPLKLKNGRVVYPDFTILDVPNRRVIYWEHFGGFESIGYAKKQYRKD